MEEFASYVTCDFSALVMSINTLTQAAKNLMELYTKLRVSSYQEIWSNASNLAQSLGPH